MNRIFKNILELEKTVTKIEKFLKNLDEKADELEKELLKYDK